MAKAERHLFGWTLTALVVLWTIATGAVQAQDNDDGPPPFPLLFEGSVLLDGALVERGELTVRIGGWESKAVPVVDGRFECTDPCLIAGPPNFDYIGLPLTFHLDGAHEASLTFPFRQGPDRISVELIFGDPGPTPTPLVQDPPIPTPTATPVPDGATDGYNLVWIAAAVVGVIGMVGGTAAVVRSRRSRGKRF